VVILREKEEAVIIRIETNELGSRRTKDSKFGR
jgi:hypothetical protein